MDFDLFLKIAIAVVCLGLAIKIFKLFSKAIFKISLAIVVLFILYRLFM
ncbi:MAG: hypothetical protein LBR30_07960 [Clostridioides sp.]|jgi:hypothetical protein|nr:hypothetical protein [Clostridioides sp.]